MKAVTVKQATLSSSILEAISSIRGGELPLIQASTKPLFPVTAELEAVAEEAERNPVPGHMMRDGTIYLGQYRPKDRQGNSLGKLFNVYAAPVDLPDLLTYDDTLEYISQLKDWYGYHGARYPTEDALYNAIASNNYVGGWIIPPCEILDGKDLDNKIITPDNISAHVNSGSFRGTFKPCTPNGSDYSSWYWSCTEDRQHESSVWSVQVSIGNAGWTYKNAIRSSCRPVRLVEVRPS